MNKTLLMVLSYQKANQMLERHWPYLLKADCDIVGVGRINTICKFPSQRLIYQMDSGLDSYVNGDNLPRLFLSAVNRFAYAPELHQYDTAIILEPDTIFLKPPPPHPGGLAAVLAGGNSPGFHGTQYFHPVWRVDRETAKLMVEYGERMLQCGLIELGFPDRFIGLMVDLYDIPWTPFPEYSQQSLDTPTKIQQAREAIIEGAVAIHGVKTFDQLQAVTSGLVTP